MDALRMYGSDSDDSESGSSLPPSTRDYSSFAEMASRCSDGFSTKTISVGETQSSSTSSTSRMPLPLPPEDLLVSPAIPESEERSEDVLGGRIRSFPHVEGNYALHVYIPVTLPSLARTDAEKFLDSALNRLPGLRVSKEGFTESFRGDSGGLDANWKSNARPSVSGEYHISLSHTVPIRIHQIESITSMLRHKLSSQKRFLVEFNSWDVFTNDERTRTFLSMENTGLGLAEIRKQVMVVNDIFKLHNLPAFYTNPRPHISLAWAVGDIESAVKSVADDLNKKISGGFWFTREQIKLNICISTFFQCMESHTIRSVPHAYY